MGNILYIIGLILAILYLAMGFDDFLWNIYSLTKRAQYKETRLIGTYTEDIYSNIRLLLDNKVAYESMSVAKNPYGDGFSSRYIADAIKNHFKENSLV